jgi:hypothetical protein
VDNRVVAMDWIPAVPLRINVLIMFTISRFGLEVAWLMYVLREDVIWCAGTIFAGMLQRDGCDEYVQGCR